MKKGTLRFIILNIIIAAAFIFSAAGCQGEGSRNTADETDPVSDERDEIADAIKPVPILVMKVNDTVYYPEPEENSSAQAFMDRIISEPLEVQLHDYGNFEKVGPLPWSLPENNIQITTEPGDIILYQGNQITVYYDVNTWNFTKLAKIHDLTREELLGVLGEGDVNVTFYVEWTE